MIRKSLDDLQTAKILFEHQRYEAASSKAYYAVFHILQTALLTKNLSFSKHSGVISAFSKYFLKERIFPVDFGSSIKRLRRDREISDYNYSQEIGEEESENNLNVAEKIIQTITEYINKMT